MSVFAPSALGFGSVSITCATAASGPSSAGHLATIASVVAALGIGSIVAAVIARWNSVSQLRQAWVDSLRREIADYFHAIEQVSAAFGDPALADRRRERRDQALLTYRQVLLRLNMSEPEHRFLSRRLRDLLDARRSADLDGIDVGMAAAKRVLKAEWERTKFGPFHALIRALKRRLLLRRLRAVRKRRYGARGR